MGGLFLSYFKFYIFSVRGKQRLFPSVSSSIESAVSKVSSKDLTDKYETKVLLEQNSVQMIFQIDSHCVWLAGRCEVIGNMLNEFSLFCVLVALTYMHYFSKASDSSSINELNFWPLYFRGLYNVKSTKYYIYIST